MGKKGGAGCGFPGCVQTQKYPGCMFKLACHNNIYYKLACYKL